MIYLDTPVCEWHWQQLDLGTDLSAAVFHIPHPVDYLFVQKIEHAVNLYQKIIILCSELHDDSVKFIKTNQHPNIQYFVCGAVEGIETKQWMDWFITTSEIYKNSNLLDQLTPYSTKSKCFDALLGWAKPHRQIVYDTLKNNNQILLSYLNDRSKSLEDLGWFFVDDNRYSDIKNTITKVEFDNQEVSISQIIPVEVYNQTAYSIVAETNYANDYSFYTEKIVKPILAERLFVVFSGQHYLRNLRTLGFKTFGNIIDETYDTVKDSNLRFKLALDQVNSLLGQNQEQVLLSIRHITEHNKKIMLETDWSAHTLADIKNFIAG